MGLAYANPPFSLLAKILTKIAYEGGRVLMCTPDWDCSDEHAYWRRMLDRGVQLRDIPIYVAEDLDTAMQATEWASFYVLSMDLSILYPCVIYIRCYRKRSWLKIVA